MMMMIMMHIYRLIVIATYLFTPTYLFTYLYLHIYLPTYVFTCLPTYLFSAVMDKLSLLIAVAPMVDLSSSLVTAEVLSLESSIRPPPPPCCCCCLSFADEIGTIVAVTSGIGVEVLVVVVTAADA